MAFEDDNQRYTMPATGQRVVHDFQTAADDMRRT